MGRHRQPEQRIHVCPGPTNAVAVHAVFDGLGYVVSEGSLTRSLSAARKLVHRIMEEAGLRSQHLQRQGTLRPMMLGQAQDASNAGGIREYRRARCSNATCLPAAEATVHLNGRMGTLPQSDFTKADARLELANFSAAMKKPQLVGEPATAELASAVLSDYGAAFMRCLPKAGQIQLERAHAATQDALYNDAHLQVKRVLAEMTAYNESGGVDPEKLDRLQRSFDFFSKQAQSHADARQGHQNTGNALQMAYLQDLVATMKSLSAKFLPLLVAVRHELGFGGELMQFQQMLEHQAARMEEAAARLPGEMTVLEAVEPAVERAAE